MTNKFKWQAGAFTLIAIASAALYCSARTESTVLTFALLGLVGIGMLMAIRVQ